MKEDTPFSRCFVLPVHAAVCAHTGRKVALEEMQYLGFRMRLSAAFRRLWLGDLTCWASLFRSWTMELLELARAKTTLCA